MIPSVLGAILFGVIVLLYVALLLGMPLGEYAMGGKHRVIPKRNRMVFAVSILIQVYGIIALLQAGSVVDAGLPTGVAKVSCYVFAVYLTLNVLMNAFSRSRKERWVMTPLSAVVAVCYWIVASGV